MWHTNAVQQVRQLVRVVAMLQRPVSEESYCHAAYQEQVRLVTRVRQAWLAAPPESVLTRGCRHSCCRDPSTAVLGLRIAVLAQLRAISFQASPGACQLGREKTPAGRPDLSSSYACFNNQLT